MRVAIIGAGAMGGVLGFYLSAGAEVVLVDGWAEHVAEINASGLRCEVGGVGQARPVRAVTDPAQAGPVDAAIILVKARQTPWAAGVAQAVLGPVAVAYTLQNGVGNREALAASLGAGRVGQGVTSLGGTLLGPGRVRHAGMGPTVFGATPSRQAAESLAALFRSCGLPSEVSDEIDSLVWGKLLVNVGINALTALLRVPNGALAALPQARDLLAQAVGEAAAVAAARGTALPYADPVGHVLSVAEATAANRSSMLQDVLRGGPTEVATINGAVVREGARLGVPTPLNSALLALVAALDESADRRISS
ncbi:2-dehydropantoate 2-reductase [Chloroflexales bacterium ZM16-3]|nr:2-dehydropantoate 2-reductase [Chloroflexales bacterium ZM16-3]